MHGQIMPTSRRVFLAAMLTASPRLQEPRYLVELDCSEGSVERVRALLERKRSTVIEETIRPGRDRPPWRTCHVKAYLPVAESFGFGALLRTTAAGSAVHQMAFHSWETMPANPLLSAGSTHDIVMAIRKRKGLKEAVPPISDFEDRP